MNIFCKCIIAGVIGLLLGSLLLCFETTAFLFPFAVTWMSISGTVIVACSVLWLFDESYKGTDRLDQRLS